MKTLKYYWQNRPLITILVIAIIVRLIAVIFAKGFGMHDDHFLVIEAAQSWVDGTDYNKWLPRSGAETPTGHNFFYVGTHFILLKLMQSLCLLDPQVKMLIIRFLHAIFSLIVVYFGFKITYKLSDLRKARFIGLLLATYWFMPWLSVRNLVEIACIPPLIWGTWCYLKAEDSKKQQFWHYLAAGILLGLSLSIRFQMMFFMAGFGLGILISRNFKAVIPTALGILLTFSFTQSIVDIKMWGYPFAEFLEYVHYNIANEYSYITNPWYSYILLMLGILLPPVSFGLFYGYFRNCKRHWPIFTSIFIFILFHSYFANKQERFILPIVPLFIIFGGIGMMEAIEGSSFLKKRPGLIKGSLIFFFSLNFLLLPIVTTMYSKKARVEAMYYLSNYPNIKRILVEDSNNSGKMYPRFYLRQWIDITDIDKSHPLDSIKGWLTKDTLAPTNKPPGFIIFNGDKDLEKRVNSVKACFPNIVKDTIIRPGLIDDLLYRANPRNANETLIIYRNKSVFPDKKL